MDKALPNNRKIAVNIRLDADVLAFIEAAASADRRSISGQINYLLSEYIEMAKEADGG